MKCAPDVNPRPSTVPLLRRIDVVKPVSKMAPLLLLLLLAPPPTTLDPTAGWRWLARHTDAMPARNR